MTPTPDEKNIQKVCFAAYGVEIAIHTNLRAETRTVINRLVTEIPQSVRLVETQEARAHRFDIAEAGGEITLRKDGEYVFRSSALADVLTVLRAKIRLTIAEYAVERVFLHAGVVVWKGRGIVMPAQTYHGKTTLVRALIDLGAIYYSDDCAVLDEHGRVYPFTKTLSVRGIKGHLEQVEFPVEQLGGVRGHKPLPVGLVLLTEYTEGAVWSPLRLTVGQGVFEMLSHTIPIRYNPKFSLKVLNNMANRAIIVKMKRGDANLFAVNLIKYFEEQAFNG